MIKRHLLAAVGVAILGIGAAGATFAQPAGRAPGPGAHGMQMDPAQRAQMRERMQARRAERLRAVLQLRQDQEPALQAFISGMAPSEEMMQRRMERRRGPGAEPLTTPQRLDRQAQRMAERQAAFQRRADVTRRFYAQLNPAQQRAFDAMRQGRGHGMRGHGRRGMRGHHMGRPGMRGGPGPQAFGAQGE